MLEQLRAAWTNLEPRPRLMLTVAVISTLLGLAVVGYWSSRPDYAVLYSGLSQEDASAILEELRTDKIPFKLAGGGAAILVPATALYETRLAIAGKGMPSGSVIGFEVFDRSGLPGTDFSNTVNLQRALQGELSRTISALSEVRAARVHLSMPRESLYSEPTPPTASVLLNLGMNGDVDAKQVRGIAYLVASAVDGLAFRDVTIVDTAGRVLQGSSQDGTEFPDTTLATAKTYSEALTRRLQTMLDSMFGANMTIVRVQAELDMDAEESDEQQVEPLPDAKTQGVSREHSSEERYNGIGVAGGGLSGVPSNLTGSGDRTSSQDGSDYTSIEETKEYEFSRKTTRRKRRPGRVTRLCVAAVVDDNLPSQATERVREVLAAAAGIDADRGDEIVVRQMELKAAELADKDAKDLELAQIAEKRDALVALLLRQGFPALVALLLLAVAIRTVGELRRVAVSDPRARTDGQPPDRHEFTGDMTSPEPQPAILESAPPMMAQTESAFNAQPSEDEQLADELRRIARERPELLAGELRHLVGGPDRL